MKPSGLVASDEWAWAPMVGTGEGLGLRGFLRLWGGHGSGKGGLWDCSPEGPTGGGTYMLAAQVWVSG